MLTANKQQRYLVIMALTILKVVAISAWWTHANIHRCNTFPFGSSVLYDSFEISLLN